MARSNETCPLGTLNAEIPKVKVPDETFEILRREAARNGMTLTEFVRNVLMVRAHGLDSVLKIHNDRLMSAAGMLSDKGDE